MRPVRLTLSAFGPYAAKETIDFRLLGERSFFLIHGPTGAGKSTILDAIAFALYGETSGGERQAAQMRSGHAEADLPTEVSLDFSLGGEAYRVARSPEQERPRKRGEGTTVQRPSATLWRRTGFMDDEEEGVVLAAQWNRVTEEVERLIGFQSDQFRQVVMLPQGQFRRFLVSDSKGREEILEVLFQTEVYKRIQEALKEEARRIHARADDLGKRQGIVLEHASVASEKELSDVRTELSARLAATAGRLEALGAEEKEVNGRLLKAREEASRIEELARAESALSAAEGRRKEIEADSVRVDRARKALGLEDVESHLRSREREQKNVLARLAASENGLAAAAREKASSGEALATEEKRESEREEARRGLDRLREMVLGVGELQAAREALDKSRRKAARISALHERKRAEFIDRRTRLEEGRKRLENLNETARKIEPLRMESERLNRLHTRATLLTGKRVELEKSEKLSTASREALQKTGKDLAAARESLDVLERTWIEGQAAVLARTLVEGAPCPVCGATDHPAPAHSARDLPDAAAVRKSRKDVQELEKRLEERRRGEDEHRAAAVALRAEVDSLQRSLDEEDGGADLQLLKKSLEDTRKLLKSAEGAQSQVKDLEKRLTTLAEEESASGRRGDRLGRGLGEAEARWKAAEAVAAERAGKVPESLRDPAALERAISREQLRLKRLLDTLELARKKHEAALGAVAAGEGTVKAAREAAQIARESLDEARERFMARLAASGFSDADEYAAAKLPLPAVEKLDAKIRSFHMELAAAGERVSRAKQAAEGVQVPDLASLESRVAEIRSALDAAIADKASLGAKIGQVDLWLRDLHEISKEMEDTERRFAVMGKLSDVANGRNAQGISFQRFVLASFLDDVLDAASKRLRRMSKGRYDLERAKERGSLRSAAGLDLVVFDSYTGMGRPVNTLSGGESFLASLALALGLVDVVQAHAGGMKLETIFVDEGFGSLDPEALDLAFETLLDLQDGHRLVGIISHVPELRERVDARLEVISGIRGSTSRFVV